MATKGNERVRRRASPLQNAVWCGLVCSLSAVFTALNLCPMEVRYQIDAQVLAGPEPLESLKRIEEAKSAATVDASEEVSAPQLVTMHVLDEKTLDRPYPGIADGEPLALLAVRSMWTSRTTTTRIREWLQDLSGSQATETARKSSTPEDRFATWYAETAAHYLNQVDRARERLVSSRDSATVPSAGLDADQTSPSSGIPAKFASLDPSNSGTNALVSTAKSEPRGEASEELREIDTIRQTLKLAIESSPAGPTRQKPVLAASLQMSQPKAVLAVSGSPRVHPIPAPLTSETFAGVLVLAMAVGAIGGWSCYRAESGGIHLPSEVSRDLELEGLPLVSVIALPLSNSTGDWIERTAAGAETLRRTAIRRLTAVCEFTLMFWCTALVVRAALDPLWRILLFDNPLAALSRMIIGMP
ncbi:MAG: hypothetical protein U0892_08640 [Pirellulales bacterium]